MLARVQETFMCSLCCQRKSNECTGPLAGLWVVKTSTTPTVSGLQLQWQPGRVDHTPGAFLTNHSEQLTWEVPLNTYALDYKNQGCMQQQTLHRVWHHACHGILIPSAEIPLPACVGKPKTLPNHALVTLRDTGHFSQQSRSYISSLPSSVEAASTPPL